MTGSIRLLQAFLSVTVSADTPNQRDDQRHGDERKQGSGSDNADRQSNVTFEFCCKHGCGGGSRGGAGDRKGNDHGFVQSQQYHDKSGSKRNHQQSQQTDQVYTAVGKGFFEVGT